MPPSAARPEGEHGQNNQDGERELREDVATIEVWHAARDTPTDGSDIIKKIWIVQY